MNQYKESQRQITYTLAKATEPILQSQFIGILVIIRDSRDSHVPFVGNRSNSIGVILHSKMHIASASEDTLPSLLFALGSGATESLHDEIVGVIVSAAARAKFGKHASVL